MSLRTSVFHMLPAHSAKPAMRRAFHFLPPSAPKSAAPLRSQTPPAGSFVMSRAATASKPRFQLPQRSLLFAGVGLGATWAAYNAFQPVHCDVALPTSSSSSSSSALNASDPAPGSILDVYQLGFGAACGVCAGVFLKKGLKAIAFMLGGAYVLLQVSIGRAPMNVTDMGSTCPTSLSSPLTGHVCHKSTTPCLALRHQQSRRVRTVSQSCMLALPIS